MESDRAQRGAARRGAARSAHLDHTDGKSLTFAPFAVVLAQEVSVTSPSAVIEPPSSSYDGSGGGDSTAGGATTPAGYI